MKSKDLRTDFTAKLPSVRRSLHALRLVGMTYRSATVNCQLPAVNSIKQKTRPRYSRDGALRACVMGARKGASSQEPCGGGLEAGQLCVVAVGADQKGMAEAESQHGH